MKKNDKIKGEKLTNTHEKLTNKMEEKLKKRSLKNRVRLAMTLSNGISVIVISFTVFIMIFIGARILTDTYIQYSASQMALVISDQWGAKENIDVDSIEHMVTSLASSEVLSRPTVAVNQQQKITEEKLNFFEDIIRNMIHYKVVYVDDVEEVILYDSEEKNDYQINSDGLKVFLQKFTSIAFSNIYSFYDMSNDYKGDDIMKSLILEDMSDDIEAFDDYKVGYVEATLNPNLVVTFFSAALFLTLILLIIHGIISSILRYFLSGMITKPVVQIANQLQAIAEGDMDACINQEIIIKRPVKEVQSMANSTNKILYKTREFMETMEQQNFELEAQKEELLAQNGTLEDRSNALSFLNEAYLGRTLNFQNLLDNVGQGFMTIGSDLKINAEYSLACESINNTKVNLEGVQIMEILATEESDKNFIEDLFNKIFEKEIDQKALYISLLPEEIILPNKVLHVEYKVVSGIKGEPQMLIITTDITEQRNLESRVEEERNILQMIVKVIMNRSDFYDLLKEFKIFTTTDFEAAKINAYEDTLRELHTFKGSFSQYYLNQCTDYLNELEERITNDPREMCNINKEQLLNILDKDIQIIKSYVGDDFFEEEDTYTIGEQQVLDLEYKLKDILPEYEFNKVLPLIQSIRHKTVQELLNSYPDYTYKLAKRLEKPVQQFSISGDKVYVDSTIYYKVFKTLVHIFRNAVDHGIENEEERLMFKKSPRASICCDIGDFKDYFRITIKDDGRGIEPMEIVEKAKKKGFYQGEEGKDIYNLLFKDGFTTMESATAISGRGIGLAAVKYAVEELGGTVEIASVLGEGTTFVINLPYIIDTSLISFSPEKLMMNVSKIIQEYFLAMNISLFEAEPFKSNKISLLRVNALISVKGAIEGIMFLSTNEALGKALAKAFILEEIDELYLTDYIEDVLGEVANTVLGNVLGELEEQGVYLTIGVPALISNKEAYMKYTESEILVSNFKKEDYELSLSLLILNGSDDNMLVAGR